MKKMITDKLVEISKLPKEKANKYNTTMTWAFLKAVVD